MRKISSLVVLAVIALLVLMATPIWAQPTVCQFYGSVTLDDNPAPDGTVIRGWIDGEMIAETTAEDAAYTLQVIHYEDANITFTITEKDITAGSSTWEVGGNKKVDISANTPPPHPERPATITLNPTEGIGPVIIAGDNFNPFETVQFSIGETILHTIPDDIKTDELGAFTGVIIVPTIATGLQDISASDTGTPSRTGHTDFTVNPVLGVTDVDVSIIPHGQEGSSSYDADTGILTVNVPEGKSGTDGEKGDQGLQGEKGLEGKDAEGGVLPIIAIILSVVAIVGIFAMFATRPKEKPATDQKK